MVGIIILAAGSSSRLGRPKQNLVYHGNTLLQRAIQTAIKVVDKPVIVVLGANEAVIRPTVEDMPVNIVQNLDWQNGIASSITMGIKEMQKIAPENTSVILMLCDQPFVDANLLNRLIDTHTKKGTDIIACTYNDAVGVPALFDAIYFDDLLQLNGQEGAKKLLSKYKDHVISIPFPPGGVDIDIIEDYKKLSKLP